MAFMFFNIIHSAVYIKTASSFQSLLNLLKKFYSFKDQGCMKLDQGIAVLQFCRQWLKEKGWLNLRET